MIEERSPSEIRLEQFKKEQDRINEKEKQKQIIIAKQKKRWQKEIDEYKKKNAHIKKEPKFFLNTKGKWLKSYSLSEISEDDIDKEVAFGFDNYKFV